MAQHRRKRLGEILVAEGLISEDDLENALGSQASAERRERLGATVVRLGLASEEDIADALATQLGYETVDLAAEAPTSAALARVPRKLADRHHALPLRIDDNDNLVVAMSDPTNIVALDDLRLTSGLRGVVPMVTTESAITDALRRTYGSDAAALEMVDAMSSSVVEVSDRDDQDDLEDLAKAADAAGDQPIIRLASAILADAARSRASDIHVEPQRDNVRVRYRIDGILREVMRVPKHVGPALVSRIKIMSHLDIAERRRPQDGRAAIRVGGDDIDLRVSSMATLFGETIVLRLLRKGAEQLTVHDLGMTADTYDHFTAALARPQGLIAITGPTGSGKTTTLYAGLKTITDEAKNLITIEDPIEYQLDGVNQSQVNPKIDLTFARGLRTILRQDPDVVMVGEIRDAETAELALEASMTGHLVLSTLHTNDAPSSVVRLMDLGIDRFLIASSLLLLSGQRLVRVVCPTCKVPAEPDPRTIELLGLTPDDLEGAELMRGEGCQLCDKTGFRGRVGVMEALRGTPEMRELIMDGGSEIEIARLAHEQGMRSLREDALIKAFAGITTLDEVLRNTPEESVTPEERHLDTSILDVPLETPERETVAHEVATVTPGQLLDDSAPDLVYRPTVLVVDDDASVRSYLGVLFEEEYELLFAADGEEAFDQISGNHIDAIVLDYKLPDTDGIAITRKLRSEIAPTVPVLMITGVEDPQLEVEGLLAGVDDFLHKPFDEDVLCARVEVALRRAARR